MYTDIFSDHRTDTVWFRVAGLIFGVNTSLGQNFDVYLPAYKPFRYNPLSPEKRLFVLETVPTGSFDNIKIEKFLNEGKNDVGKWRLYQTAQGFCLDLQYVEGAPWHRMVTDPFFTRLILAIDWSDKYAIDVLNSFTMFGFAQAAVQYNTALIHASVTMKAGEGYLFLGTSGTGKSTHSQLWLTHLDNTELLNDDNPAIRICPDNEIRVFGTPWSGKTPCYKNKQAHLKAFVQLKQAPHNRFSYLKGIQAYLVLLAGCSSLKWNTTLYNRLGSLLEQMANRVPVGFLECRPDKEAAILCYNELNKK